MTILTHKKQTTDIATLTLGELQTQAEVLNRVEDNLDTINADMKKADKTLTNMEKWFGLFTCPCNRYIHTFYFILKKVGGSFMPLVQSPMEYKSQITQIDT